MKIWDKHCLSKSLFVGFLSVLSFSLLSAEAYYDDSVFYEDIVSEIEIQDPLELWNRCIFGINDVIYQYVVGPTNKVYTDITNESTRESLRNFVYNLKFPIRFLSNIAQLKAKEAFYESLKFTLNSTVGILGLNRPSDRFIHLAELEEESFGNALACWGVPEGPYFIIPLLGPSTLRDFPTRVIEPIINPFGDSGNIFDSASREWMVTFYLSEFFVLSSEMLPRYDLMKSASLDPYISLRTAYYQGR